MVTHVKIASKWALAVALPSFLVFVYLYRQYAQPFEPQPVPLASAPALILGVPIAALTFVIVFGLVFACLEMFHQP